MPTYINNGSSTVIIDHPPLKIPAGATVALNYYIKPLPYGVAKTLETPLVQPWVLLEDTEGIYDVSTWDYIIVYNGMDDIITIAANTDTDNALYVVSKAKEVYDNTTNVFGCLEIVDSPGSTGQVFIYGAR
jgi:hypothetical protein